MLFGGPGSHRHLLVALVRSDAALGSPLLELVDALSESVCVVEGVVLHGGFEPLAVLFRHGLELGGRSAILVLH